MSMMECMAEDYRNHSIGSLTVDLAANEVSRFAMLFYVVNPSTTTVQYTHQVMDYYQHVSGVYCEPPSDGLLPTREWGLL